MSLPSHRLPPPVSQTVGGAAAAAVASAAVSDKPAASEASPAVADSYRQQAAKVLRQAGQQQAADPSAVRAMPPARHDSARTSAGAPDTKQRTGSDVPRPMRPQSVLKHYMKYLTPYEHQEIFEYSPVERQRLVAVCSL